jgi:hypothetical protein
MAAMVTRRSRRTWVRDEGRGRGGRTRGLALHLLIHGELVHRGGEGEGGGLGLDVLPDGLVVFVEATDELKKCMGLQRIP